MELKQIVSFTSDDVIEILSDFIRQEFAGLEVESFEICTDTEFLTDVELSFNFTVSKSESVEDDIPDPYGDGIPFHSDGTPIS